MNSQYLSFSLGEEEYAIDILRVQEIRGVCPITPLPQSRPAVRGVMNLRGAVVPVVDMRAALGVGRGEFGPFTVIIVVTVGRRTVGFVVDSVSDVLSFESSAIERTPELSARVDASVVHGIARTDERFVMLLDIDRVAGLEIPEEAA